MNAQKFIEVQHQMRHNQADVSDFLKDLDGWETNIKIKDEKLKTETPSQEKSSNLPPVRNSLEKKKRKKKKKINDGIDAVPVEQKNNPKRISGYDYRAWDKFDVDQACDELGSDRASSSSSEYETDEEWEVLRKKQQAIMHKEQGNQYFKEGKYTEAVECYTRGIDADPMNGLLPANRAMGLLKLERFGAAELDCTASISIDPTYVKAYHRRGTARLGLKKLKEAQDDFHRVMKLEPQNKMAKTELEKIEKLLNPPEFSQNVEGEVGIVKPIYKKPQERSKKPLHRLTIEEIGEDEEDERKKKAEEIKSSQSKTKQDIVAKDSAEFEAKFGSKSNTNKIQIGHTETNVDKSGARATSIDQNASIEQLGETLSPADVTKVTTNLTAEENGISLEVNEKEGSKISVTDDNLQNELKLDLNKTREDSTEKHNVRLKPEASSGSSDSPRTSPRVPPVPASSFQFQADWKVLKDTKDQFYQYLKQIDPASYSKLFGQALDADVLLKILTTLKDVYIPNDVSILPVLQSLTGVKRFAMTVMFMSSQEKQVIHDLFQHLTMPSNSDSATTEINSLAKKYEI